MSGGYFFVIRHDQRHGNRPYHYRLHYTTPSISKHLRTLLEHKEQQAKHQEIGFGRSPERLQPMVSLFTESVVVTSC